MLAFLCSSFVLYFLRLFHNLERKYLRETVVRKEQVWKVQLGKRNRNSGIRWWKWVIRSCRLLVDKDHPAALRASVCARLDNPIGRAIKTNARWSAIVFRVGRYIFLLLCAIAFVFRFLRRTIQQATVPRRVHSHAHTLCTRGQVLVYTCEYKFISRAVAEYHYTYANVSRIYALHTVHILGHARAQCL